MSTPPDNVYFGKSGVTYNLNTNTESLLSKKKKKKKLLQKSPRSHLKLLSL